MPKIKMPTTPAGTTTSLRSASLGAPSVRKVPQGMFAPISTSSDLASLGHLPLKGKA